MSEVIRKIKLAQLETELMDIQRNILKHEGIINSLKITSNVHKNQSKKKLLELVKEKNRLTDIITESMFLDLEL